VNIVRNHDVVKEVGESGYWDHSLWERTKQRGDAALKALIEGGLNGTSVVVVLIGHETANRRWVQYELGRGFDLGKGMLGVRIHRLKNFEGYPDLPGHNPLDDIIDNETERPLSHLFNTYDWVDDDGYRNFADWVEEAAQLGGR